VGEPSFHFFCMPSSPRSGRITASAISRWTSAREGELDEWMTGFLDFMRAALVGHPSIHPPIH
jgi:hypothetical protein